MAGLYYVGTTAAADRDVESRASTIGVFTGGMTRTYVTSAVATAVSGTAWATKTQVDGWDAAYAAKEYYGQQDALLVPKSSKGAPNGVASLTTATAATLAGGTGYVIAATQLPVLGAGILRGPWGINRQYARNGVGSVPQIVGEWVYNPNTAITNFGTVSHTGRFLAFTSTAARNVKGRTVLEVRAGTSNVYAEQSLIATGYGRTYFDGYQMITVLPTGSPPLWVSGSTAYVTLWMFNDGGGLSEIAEGMTYTGALFLARTAT